MTGEDFTNQLNAINAQTATTPDQIIAKVNALGELATRFQNEAVAAAERQEKINAAISFGWHSTILICSIATCWILWRIYKQKQIPAYAVHQQPLRKSEKQKPNSEHDWDSSQATKSHSPPIPNQNVQPLPATTQSAPADSSPAVHPHSRYMPKS